MNVVGLLKCQLNSIFVLWKYGVLGLISKLLDCLANAVWRTTQSLCTEFICCSELSSACSLDPCEKLSRNYIPTSCTWLPHNMAASMALRGGTDLPQCCWLFLTSPPTTPVTKCWWSSGQPQGLIWVLILFRETMRYTILRLAASCFKGISILQMLILPPRFLFCSIIPLALYVPPPHPPEAQKSFSVPTLLEDVDLHKFPRASCDLWCHNWRDLRHIEEDACVCEKGKTGLTSDGGI